MGAMKVWDGSTWQTVAPFSERASVYVGPDQPAGATYAGDLWWDTDDPAPSMPGQELAYSQAVAPVNVTATTAATANLIVEGVSLTYDGSPVIVEFCCHVASAAGAGAQLVFALWDASTDLGLIGMLYAAAGAQLNAPVDVRRRITPTAGTHNYRIVGYATVGSGTAYAGPGGASQWSPMYVRVTRV